MPYRNPNIDIPDFIVSVVLMFIVAAAAGIALFLISDLVDLIIYICELTYHDINNPSW